MHRNTYINSPCALDKFYSLRENKKLFFAGQITGVEGYVESAASGLLAGIYAAKRIMGKDLKPFLADTAIGALSNYVSNSSITNFQPMNINYGIISDLGVRVKDKKKKAEMVAERSFNEIDSMINSEDL